MVPACMRACIRYCLLGHGGGATELHCERLLQMRRVCRTIAKAVPAIIFLVTAVQMLSDNVPWWPGRTNSNERPEWTRPASSSKDDWNSTAEEIQAEMSASFSAPSSAVNVSLDIRMPWTP